TWLRLGLGRQILVASSRSLIQLSLLGMLLVPVFRIAHPALVLGMAIVMVLAAAVEAVRRARRSYRGVGLHALGSLGVSGLATGVLGTAGILGVQPWYEPRYLIPLLGMILGNALTGVSLGLDRCLEGLDAGRDRVEEDLAFGATRWEASRPVVAGALRAALVPILNTMSVVGLVSIPGMMTGQILGGTPPEQAARYQIVILFMVAGATAMASTGAVLLAARSLFDDAHRLRADRVTVR
ncbi:MAG: iron export ABC transporter permease subunit FetB, partial [Gammaproteobacteria bacterium]|nr:iron export ABC transporter permease subunit FetB [Gammaproteobacteria bacterium]